MSQSRSLDESIVTIEYVSF